LWEVVGFKSDFEIQFAARIRVFHRDNDSLEVGTKLGMLIIFAYIVRGNEHTSIVFSNVRMYDIYYPVQ